MLRIWSENCLLNYGVKKALSQVNPSSSKDFGMVLHERTVENRLMMILMRLALSGSVRSGLSRSSDTTRQDSQCDQDVADSDEEGS